MGKTSSRSIALDAGALIALESSKGRALLREWDRRSSLLVISAAALAQAVRDPGRQVLLSRLLRHERTVVGTLDEYAAIACGRLLAEKGGEDVVDANVVLSAREHDASVIVTSDDRDLTRLDPEVGIETI